MIEQTDKLMLLQMGMGHISESLAAFMDVKSEIGVKLAAKAYDAIRIYEKYCEKQLKEME